MAKKQKTDEKAPPPEFSDELAASICSKIATGETLEKVCAALHSSLTPDLVYLWLFRSPEFTIQYREAKKAGMMRYLEDTVAIADDDSGDTYEAKTKDGDTYDAPNSAAVNRAKLKVETRKWAMSVLARDVFGEVKSGGGGDGGETTVKIVGGLPE